MAGTRMSQRFWGRAVEGPGGVVDVDAWHNMDRLVDPFSVPGSQRPAGDPGARAANCQLPALTMKDMPKGSGNFEDEQAAIQIHRRVVPGRAV